LPVPFSCQLRLTFLLLHSSVQKGKKMSFKAKAKQKPLVIFKNLAILG
jgi:hypothetical protein